MVIKRITGFFVAIIVVVTMLASVAAASKVYQMSADFSDTQGPIWFYQYKLEKDTIYKDFEVYMGQGTTGKWVINSYNYLKKGEFLPYYNPDGSKNQAILTWVAPEDGNILIEKTKVFTWFEEGDGVQIKITKNGVNLWPTDNEFMFIPPTYLDENNLGFDKIDIPEIKTTVKKGDKIHFVSDMFLKGMYDNLTWDPKLTLTTAQVGTSSTAASSTVSKTASSAAASSEIVSSEAVSSEIVSSEAASSEEESVTESSSQSEIASNADSSSSQSSSDTDSSGFPVLPIIIGAVVLAGAAGLGILLMKNKNKI